MLFKFQKYLQPTHYFSLSKVNKKTIFPIVERLPESIKLQLEPDEKYSCKTAQDYDLSWQAIQKGYIGNAKTYRSIEELSIVDNYHFIRTCFHKAWVFYVLVCRIFSFHNPIKELKAWYKTRTIKQSDYLQKPIQYPDWQTFDSLLVKNKPKVTVIIPTLNRYTYLRDVLHDLEQQDYINFEVIVIDQSEPFRNEFYESFNLDLNVIQQKEKALWLARNTAIKCAKGQYLLFFDDDSRVESDWITNHLKCLDFFDADISSGVSISKTGGKVPENYAFFRVSDQLDTGNALIKKEVFKSIGLFDRQFEQQRMGDGEFGLRAYLNGYLNVSNPYAKRLHLKVDSGGLRQFGSWDAFRTTKWFAPRPIPSVLYFFRRYYGDVAAKRALLKSVPLSVIPYRFKKNKGFLILGAMISFLMTPILIFQVYRSWSLSTKKLIQGPLINTLDT